MNALEQAQIEARHDDEFACDDSTLLEELYEQLCEATAILRSLENEIPAGRGKSSVDVGALLFWRKEKYRLENAYIVERRKANAAADFKRSDDEFPF